MTSRARTADDPLRVRHTPTSPGRGFPPRRHRSPGLPPLAAAALSARSVASLLQPLLLAPPPPPPLPTPPLLPPPSSMLLLFPPFLHLRNNVLRRRTCVCGRCHYATDSVRSAMLLRCVDRGGACRVCLNLLTCARVSCARSSVACAGVAMLSRQRYVSMCFCVWSAERVNAAINLLWNAPMTSIGCPDNPVCRPGAVELAGQRAVKRQSAYGTRGGRGGRGSGGRKNFRCIFREISASSVRSCKNFQNRVSGCFLVQ